MNPSVHSPIDYIKFLANEIRLGTVKFLAPEITKDYLLSAINAAQTELDLLAPAHHLLSPREPKLTDVEKLAASPLAPKPPAEPTIPAELDLRNQKVFQQLTDKIDDLRLLIFQVSRNRKKYAQINLADLKWKEKHLRSEIKSMRIVFELKKRSFLKAYFEALEVYETALKDFLRSTITENERLIAGYKNAQLNSENRNITLSAIESAKGYLNRMSQNSYHGSLPDHKLLNWDFLPSGKWSPNKIVEYLRKLSKQNQEYRWDLERLEYILSLNPHDCYLGKEEFDGYVAFTFSRTTKVVLEHPVYGHAMYVFFSDWKSLSRLTKMELLSQYSGEIQRIIHTGEWKKKLKSCLT